MLYLPAEFPLEPELCYLNHAGIGPWPRRTAQTVASFAQRNMLRGGADYLERLEVENRLRARLAMLINAPCADDIALVKNTSEGLSIVAEGIAWRPGDRVLAVAGDFCSNTMVWEQLQGRGVIFEPVDAMRQVDPESVLIAALDHPGTRLLAVSTVHFATGFRLDLRRLAEACRLHGVLLAVDAIQSLGAARFDLQQTPADFVTAGGHKWLLGAEGLGFLYVRPALRDGLQLRQHGWAMRETPYDFEHVGWVASKSARRFECGTPNMLGIYALDSSLGLFDEVGWDFVERRLAENVTYLIEELGALPGVEVVTPVDPERRLGILSFRLDGVSQEALYRRLTRRGVVCADRAGGIRLAPHFYTPRQVLDRALEIIAD